jgi:two-component system phosphate regulon sensor histidine kinase PhoR
MEPVSAAGLLAEAVALMRDAARSSGSQVTMEAAPEIDVLADAQGIQQVLTNLIDNAIKYTPGKIVVGGRELQHAVEFYVRDFGPGIPSEHLPRLFERFYRVDRARSRESGGTGLGLAIVKHIVLAHGGNVRVESRVGHGSTFYFSLPRVTPAELPAAEAASSFTNS